MPAATISPAAAPTPSVPGPGSGSVPVHAPTATGFIQNGIAAAVPDNHVAPVTDRADVLRNGRIRADAMSVHQGDEVRLSQGIRRDCVLLQEIHSCHRYLLRLRQHHLRTQEPMQGDVYVMHARARKTEEATILSAVRRERGCVRSTANVGVSQANTFATEGL